MTVFVGQLKGFKKSIKNISSAYVRLTVYDNERKLRRRKTTSINVSSLSTSLPAVVSCTWNESLQFDLSKDKLQSGLLTFELTIFGTEHSLLAADSVIGGISLGPRTPLNSSFVKQTIRPSSVRSEDQRWIDRSGGNDQEDFDDDDGGGGSGRDDWEIPKESKSPWWEAILSERHQSPVEFYPLQ